MMAGSVAASMIAGKVMSKTGRYKIFPIVGSASLAVGMGLLATMDTTTSRIATSAFMILVGIGTGFSIQMADTIAQNSVELRDIGAASAATSLFRTLGGALGVAVFGSLLPRATEARRPPRAWDQPPTACHRPARTPICTQSATAFSRSS